MGVTQCFYQGALVAEVGWSEWERLPKDRQWQEASKACFCLQFCISIFRDTDLKSTSLLGLFSVELYVRLTR